MTDTRIEAAKALAEAIVRSRPLFKQALAQVRETERLLKKIKPFRFSATQFYENAPKEIKNPPPD